MADRARADCAARCRGRAGRAGRRGCRLWRGHGVSRCADRPGHCVRRGHQHRDDCLGARPRTAATPEVSTPRPEEWLLIEWPRAEAAPIKYWLSTLPQPATRADLVRLAMLRWRIERDYQELKDELGLDHFEGRGWRGFHHHASLCIAAYAFLAAERLAHFPPEPLAFLQAPRVPKRFIPRGAPGAS